MNSLIFIGILSSLAVTTSGQELVCRNFTGKSDLDIKRFYNGRWYLTNLEHTVASNSRSICVQTKNDVQEDGTVNHYLSVYDQLRKIKYETFHCTTNMKDIVDGKAIFSCDEKKAQRVEKFTVEATVVETDYDSYGVFHFCSKIGNTVTGSDILIMHRALDSKPTDPKLLDLLKSYDLDINSFKSRQDEECKDDPDF
ncbi:hypothetical protein O3M35_012253 [Rhynocoris fuscipes]|uniref:Uncharacterized protein n=1 Tax=Rhynocoris fuscipes TaxID=488301 RepID=A0AAW1CRQ2_9HEMI